VDIPQDTSQKSKLPEPHQKFIENSVPRLKKDPRILGVAVGGSFLLNELDEYSDLDLVVYVDPKHYAQVLKERESIVKNMDSLLESFTGEHVGEPRLLICLFGPPLLHIDLKFVSMDDIKEKVENPIVLWEREAFVSSQVYLEPADFPRPNHEWIEKRFWVWVHYTATKIARGELFEALEAIAFLRGHVLGPIILEKHGARPQGLRQLETHASQGDLKQLRATLTKYDAGDCLRALRESVILYETIRHVMGNEILEKHVKDYLTQTEKRIG
jgi:predicted nucleotidyltransferase